MFKNTIDTGLIHWALVEKTVYNMEIHWLSSEENTPASSTLTWEVPLTVFWIKKTTKKKKTHH